MLPETHRPKKPSCTGDVILEIDGKKIRNPSDFQEGIDDHRVGDKASIKIFRKGKEGVAEVELGKPGSKEPSRSDRQQNYRNW